MVLKQNKEDGSYSSHVQRKKDFINLRLNNEEWLQLDRNKKILNQPKDSTAVKQLVAIATKVIHDKKIMEIVELITENKRKNKRTGIIEYEV